MGTTHDWEWLDYTTYKNGDDGMVHLWHCFTRIKSTILMVKLAIYNIWWWNHNNWWLTAIIFLRLKFNTMSVCLKIEYPKIQWLIEGNLEVKLPTIWTDEKQRWEESERREENKKEERVRRKKMQVREKVGKSRNTESRDSLCFSNDLWLRRVEK